MKKPLLNIELNPEMDDLHSNILLELSKYQIHPKNDLHQAIKHDHLKRQNQDDQDIKYVAILSCN